MALTLPGIESLKAYERRWLARDLVVGLVLTALLVPQGMAYAELAGLPPVTGLYTSILCLASPGVAPPPERRAGAPERSGRSRRSGPRLGPGEERPVLYVFGFESIGVVVSDLYFVDPNPGPGQEGAERGVRLEVRILERGELRGSIYSAQPIAVERPIWRGDLLESVAGMPGSHDRTHHHPRFTGWEPGHRQFVEELSVDPLGWVAARLGDLDGLLAEAGVGTTEIDPRDGADLRSAVPEIVESIRRLLERVRAGEIAQPPAEGAASVRVGWL